MYEVQPDGAVTITVNDWQEAGLTYKQYNHDSCKGYLSIYKRGINGNTLIDVRSIRRPDRLRIIEKAYGKLEKKAPKAAFTVEIDETARQWFINYRKPDNAPLDPDNIVKYTNRASILRGIHRGLQKQQAARAKAGKRMKMGEFWELAVDWYAEQTETYPCAPIGNPRTLERVFKSYLDDLKNGGYWSILHKGEGNDFARKVSAKAERLIVALWKTFDQPFVATVHERYLDFVAGTRTLVDIDTGEEFNPEEFRHNGKALEISPATVWNYLKDIVNNTAVYADRNGNFSYVNTHRPKHHRKPGRFSLSKISMDDVALSRKSVRGWVYKYIAVDVVSGYYFRPAYVVGKPTHQTVYEAFRNMFCELSAMGLPMPGELEVEYHLMKDMNWLGEVFKFVRFCESPTEKRAEHAIKAFKYGVSKKEGHTRGRWYAKHEAYRSVRNKMNGDFVEPEFQPQTIVADDLADVEKHNNTLHPLQKTYPGMTRRQVLLQNINPKLKPIEPWFLYRYIGNLTETSIYKNDYCPVANEEFELVDFECLHRLKPNSLNVEAYWLPEEDGSIKQVYLWQGDTYIGEAVNRAEKAYNECAAERTDEDEANILYQQKRVAKFDKFIKSQRSEVPKLVSVTREERKRIEDLQPVIVPETEQPKNEADEFETPYDWDAIAISSL